MGIFVAAISVVLSIFCTAGVWAEITVLQGQIDVEGRLGPIAWVIH